MFTSWFHRHTKTLPHIPADENEWPESWKMTRYKVYLRSKQYPLKKDLEIPVLDTNLPRILTSRKTTRNFRSTQLTFEEISYLLALACGEQDSQLPREDRNRRTYPSAGGLYPIEVYLYVRWDVGEELPAGLYHYRPDMHLLEAIYPACGAAATAELFMQDWQSSSPVVVFLTGVLERHMYKYSYKGYRFLHLEAGFIAQNLSLVSHMLGIGTAMIGGVEDATTEQFIDIDGVNEVLLSTLLVGYPSAT